MSRSSGLGSLLRVKQRIHLTSALADSTPGVRGKAEVEALQEKNLERLSDLQYQLFVDGRFGLLIVLQAMDTGGKDGTIRHVFSAFSPQGCTVSSFKVPSAEEARHDFLWRIHQRVPPRGHIGVFNRSHYEDVLVVRVDNLAPREAWKRRYAQINAFEESLAAQGIRVVKFMLHVSKGEQLERLRDRLRRPHKLWKFDPADLEKRQQWTAYRNAYEDALEECNAPSAPWYVIPADHKWYRDYAVASIVRETLEEMPLRWPKPKFDPRKIRLK